MSSSCDWMSTAPSENTKLFVCVCLCLRSQVAVTFAVGSEVGLQSTSDFRQMGKPFLMGTVALGEKSSLSILFFFFPLCLFASFCSLTALPHPRSGPFTIFFFFLFFFLLSFSAFVAATDSLRPPDGRYSLVLREASQALLREKYKIHSGSDGKRVKWTE